MGLFDAYVFGSRFGVVLLAGGQAALMWGEAWEPLSVDTDFGRVAQGWGTYVRPEARGQGLSRALRQEAQERLRVLGFDSVVGGAHYGNEVGRATGVGAGFELYQTLGVLRLREVP